VWLTSLTWGVWGCPVAADRRSSDAPARRLASAVPAGGVGRLRPDGAFRDPFNYGDGGVKLREQPFADVGPWPCAHRRKQQPARASGKNRDMHQMAASNRIAARSVRLSFTEIICRIEPDTLPSTPLHRPEDFAMNISSLHATRRAIGLCAAIVAASLLSGCAHDPSHVPVGASRDDLVKLAGPPTSQYTREGQKRWEYANGPNGAYTWMVDLDEVGRVKAINQVLTDSTFMQIRPGMASNDLLWSLGRPSDQQVVNLGTMLWQYRYDAKRCFWFVITLTPESKVDHTSYLPDPLCDPGAAGYTAN
jgi:outer membrane protein assembly factor BamE (lipoprotein component of BamABCDE complex)